MRGGRTVEPLLKSGGSARDTENLGASQTLEGKSVAEGLMDLMSTLNLQTI